MYAHLRLASDLAQRMPQLRELNVAVHIQPYGRRLETRSERVMQHMERFQALANYPTTRKPGIGRFRFVVFAVRDYIKGEDPEDWFCYDSDNKLPLFEWKQATHCFRKLNDIPEYDEEECVPDWDEDDDLAHLEEQAANGGAS